MKELRLDNVVGLRRDLALTNVIVVTGKKINELLINPNIRKIYIEASSCKEMDRIYDLITKKAARKRLYVVVNGGSCFLGRINGRLGTTRE